MNRAMTELALIAGILAHPAMAFEAVPLIDAEAITDARLGAVYQVIRSLADRGELPTRTAVVSQLVASGIAEHIGASGIAQLKAGRSQDATRAAMERVAIHHRADLAIELLSQGLADIKRSPERVDAIFAQHLDEATAGLGTQAGGRAVELVDGQRRALQRARERESGERTVDAWPTGMPEIDDHFVVGPDMLVILGAISGGGKTAVAMWMQRNLLRAQADAGVLHFSFADQTGDQVAERMLSAASAVPTRYVAKLKPGAKRLDRMQDAVADSARRFEGRMQIIEDHSPIVEDVVHACRRWRARMAARGVTLRMVVLDYAGAMRLRDRARMNRTDELKEVSKVLKVQIARAMGLTVVLGAQLNREYMKAQPPRLPKASDIRDSSEMEFHADAVVLVHKMPLTWHPALPDTAWQHRLGGLLLCGVKYRGPALFRLPIISDTQIAEYWPLTDCPHLKVADEEGAGFNVQRRMT